MAAKVDMKVVLLGKEFGGKTSLVERFLHERFAGGAPYQNTIGAAFGAKKVTVNGETITLGIWDTAGSERYEAMSRIYYRGAKAAVLCIDLTDETSFKRARFWVNELKTNEEECKLFIAGTKQDVVIQDKKARKVDGADLQDFADESGARLFETSAKTGHNVEELFQEVASACVSARGQATFNPNGNTVALDSSGGKSSGCC
ncbi:ras-related protein Rab-24-like [Sycon ciliatum]|uniref:ras-related protein Rab-24-like n=1 Tax=Sycon ciliatum TaxID=27933 RepID=UPI0031F6C51F